MPTPRTDKPSAWREEIESLRKELLQGAPSATLMTRLANLEKRLQEEAQRNAEAQQRALHMVYTLAHDVNASLDWMQTIEPALKILVTMTRAERGLLLLLDENGQPHVRSIHYAATPSLQGTDTSFSRSIVQEALQRAQPILTSDAQLDPRFSGQDSVVLRGLHAVLCVPLIALGRTLGAIYLENRTSGNAFSDEDVELLGMAAELTALAITNAQKYQLLQQRLNARNRDVKFLQEMLIALDEDYNYTRIIHQGLLWAMRAVGAARGALGTLETGGLRWQAQQGGAALNNELAHHVLQQRRAQISQHQMVVPLLRARHPLGVLVLESETLPFSDEQSAVAQQVANLMALYLESARLYEALRGAREAQWRLVDQMLESFAVPLQALEHGEAQAPSLLRRAWENLRLFALLEQGRYPLALLPVKLRPALEAALEACRPAWMDKALQVELDLEDNLPPVLADSEALNTIFLHLLDNAIAYTPAQGRIILRITTDPHETGTLVCSIEDSGYGINLTEQREIFTPFFRSQDPRVQAVPGSGLGLAIVKRLVEIHGGVMGFHSEPGVGSRFFFTLPQSDNNGLL